jgi:hypothetical protein
MESSVERAMVEVAPPIGQRMPPGGEKDQVHVQRLIIEYELM